MNCTPDLWRGTGLDDAITPMLDQESLDSQVEVLLAELPDVFVLAGVSLGAILGMALSAAAPDRVAGLCLVSTNAKAPTSAQVAGWQDWITRIDAGESAEDLQRTIVSSLLAPTVVRKQPDVVERVLAMGREVGDDQLRSQLRLQQTRVDLREGLRSLTAPTLVVSGKFDPICPPGFHQEIVNHVPHATLVSLNAGHLLPMERPEEFGWLLSSWRRDLRGAR